MNRIIASFMLALCSTLSFSQRPDPAGLEFPRVLLMGATAHTGDGNVIEMSAIGLDNGKISFIMDGKGFKPDPRAFDTIIYVNGRHVYPGFIAMGTNLGLSDLELVRATNDFRETGDFNPGARSLIAYNTDSRVIPTVRDNGVLMAQVAPQGGQFSGTSSVVHLDAWNWEDAVVKEDDGIWVNWPSMRIYKGRDSEAEDEQRSRKEKEMQSLLRRFEEAAAYSKSRPAVRNSHFEAMAGLFDGTKKLYVRCDFAREIIEAVQVAKRYGMKLVIFGGSDSWRVAGLLKENDVAVVIERTHALPYRDDEAVDNRYRLPAMLKQAGVTFAITDQGFWQQRNVAFQAGSAAAYGLTREEALTSVTLSPARILGMDSFAGSLADGKDATLFISNGDALEMTGNKVELAFVSGRMIDLNNFQKDLYRRYVKKYGIVE